MCNSTYWLPLRAKIESLTFSLESTPSMYIPQDFLNYIIFLSTFCSNIYYPIYPNIALKNFGSGTTISVILIKPTEKKSSLFLLFKSKTHICLLIFPFVFSLTISLNSKYENPHYTERNWDLRVEISLTEELQSPRPDGELVVQAHSTFLDLNSQPWNWHKSR